MNEPYLFDLRVEPDSESRSGASFLLSVTNHSGVPVETTIGVGYRILEQRLRICQGDLSSEVKKRYPFVTYRFDARFYVADGETYCFKIPIDVHHGEIQLRHVWYAVERHTLYALFLEGTPPEQAVYFRITRDNAFVIEPRPAE